jgi:HAD superfamily hydrolase (TIGR01509 family)
MSYAALLLDLDGTLVDSEPRHFVAHERFLATVGMPVTRAEVVGNVGKGDRAFYRSLCARQGVTVDVVDWVQRKTDVLMQLYRDEGLPLRPGVHDLLERAAQRGIFAHVVTSAERRLAALTLEVTGLAARLPARICHEDVTAHKPSPEPYLLACQRLGVPPARCLVVEDSLSGVRAGVAAGCTVVGFAGIVTGDELRAVGAHRIVDSLAEVVL